MRHLLIAISNKEPAREVIIISIIRIDRSVFASKSDRNHQYLVEYKAECAVCGKNGVQESNIYGGHLSHMCRDCTDDASSDLGGQDSNLYP